MQSPEALVVILGTGGTIAGTASDTTDHVGYTAGQLGVNQLVAAVPALAGASLEAEQVAQLDSKDMDFATWRALALRCSHHLARPEVAGIVVTHGTDTLEETAWFLQRVLAPSKPVVLTAAMRPATALSPDGPQNLVDALRVARWAGARGVVAVLAGRVHAARDVRKVHPYRVDAFGSGDAGVIGEVEQGALRLHRPWPDEGAPLGVDRLPAADAAWPRVEIVTSHAGSDGGIVRAIVAAGVRGIVVAGTGNGSLHRALEAALRETRAAGVRVLRTTRCRDGRVVGGGADAWASADDLTPEKARVDLLLDLLSADAASVRPGSA
ncbi:MAG: asparaginase [Rhizobacter sp.]